MIKAIRQTKKPYLSLSFLSNRFGYCTKKNNPAQFEEQVGKFNGYMLPVVYPIWVSSGIRINVSPKISEVLIF